MEEYETQNTPWFGEQPCCICDNFTKTQMRDFGSFRKPEVVICNDCDKKLPRKWDEPFYIRLAKWLVNK